MHLRKIQLFSNIYKDNKAQGQAEIETEQLGKYCVFGPFDAMDFVEEGKGKLSPEEYRRADKVRDKCRCFNINCLTPEEEVEEEAVFFSQAERYPFLFLSFYVYSERERDTESLRSQIRTIGLQRPDCRFYFSYEKYDFVLMHFCNQYTKGLNTVLDIQDRFPKAKVSTVFTVQEGALDAESDLHRAIVDDVVGLRLQGIMVDRIRTNAYLEELKGIIIDECVPMERMQWYDVLGSTDILVEIDGVSMKRVLALYKSGEILTHMSPKYKEAWYNIETKFIAKRDDACHG